MPKSSQTWVKEAFEAHAQFIEEGYVDLEPGEFDRCWCCGNSRRKLQRCHIIPAALGGSDAIENLIPLCSRCHDKQPDVDDPVHTFEWIKAEQNPLTGVGMGDRWEVMQKTMELTKQMKPNKIQCEAIKEWFVYFLDTRVNNHCGQSGQGSYVKDASILWAFTKALEKTCGKLPDPDAGAAGLPAT